MAKKYTNKSKLLGKIGTENYRVSNCPVHLPKENIKFFMAMQDAGNKDPFSTSTYANQITPDWKKPFHESIVSAISKGIKNVLNESNSLRTDEECLRANLICLYDHCDQQNFYIIKNPSIEDIKEIGEYHNRYYWKHKDNDNKKDKLVANFLEWHYYNIKLDGLTCIEYDDENVNLCSFDVKNDNELYKLAYNAYTDKENGPLKSDGSFKSDPSKETRIDYVLNILGQYILNKRDYYGFGIGMRVSFIEYFFKDYKDLIKNKWNKKYEESRLKDIKEKEKILSSYNSFESYMRNEVEKSFCGGDSSSAILLLNLKTEQIFDQAPSTKIHFIKTFQEYKNEMYEILTKDHKIKESHNFNFNSILNEELAIDDFNYNDVSSNQPNSDIIDAKDVIQYKIDLKKFNECCDKLNNNLNNFNYEDLHTVNKLHKQYGFTYKIVVGFDGNAEILASIIEYITRTIDTEADLNWINVTAIKDMSYLFNKSQFNGDISEWDVSNVKDMAHMFDESAFDGSFSDISGWDVSNVEWFDGMFLYSPFNKADICNWNMKNAHSTSEMFIESLFCQDISNWNLPLGCEIEHMFSSDFPQKYKPRVINDIIKIHKENFGETLEDTEPFEDERLRNDELDEGFMFEGECGGECGGVGGSYNTPMNTVGVGNVVPAGMPAMTGSAQSSDMFNGSGDTTLPASSKKKSKKKLKQKETLYFPIAVKK